MKKIIALAVLCATFSLSACNDWKQQKDGTYAVTAEDTYVTMVLAKNFQDIKWLLPKPEGAGDEWHCTEPAADANVDYQELAFENEHGAVAVIKVCDTQTGRWAWTLQDPVYSYQHITLTMVNLDQEDHRELIILNEDGTKLGSFSGRGLEEITRNFYDTGKVEK